jgi:transcription-repair coupling factor (superfamily II helicase)
MAASRPMDRLICGDAGYGKTEIAMRAAFIAVMNGRQVAVLVPTTVLAEQHFETFSDRMSAYPVRVEAVSRFKTYSHRQKILAAAAEGKVDILIGTHALLGNGVSFKNLGLLVIDEEQRFGVAHKERLKQIRQIVDVLTLSATPIPRTLYMSMTGARDLSLLQTPPRERLAVETKVARDTDTVIQTAIKQELHRDGQVYFLYNRVMSIGLMMRRLSTLVPEARIAIAHGQMPASELAEVMHEFEAGEIDVLLCTTLVESGLDIPRANTILVHRADRFGIADLYQLRGRVGRSSQKGFAWLLLPEYGHIDEDARQRIAALQKHSGLGAGFNLALRDLEIRGAGNLLGATQSGHIAAIGFGLYCQLLRRTIARMKGELPPLLVDVDLALDFLDYSPGTIDVERSACIPYHYVEDEGHRMIIHRRLAEAVSSQEVASLKVELTDRYGKVTPPVLRLLRITELRIHAAERHIGRIETREGKVYIYPSTSRNPVTFHNQIPLLKGRNSEEKIANIIKSLQQLPLSR